MFENIKNFLRRRKWVPTFTSWKKMKIGLINLFPYSNKRYNPNYLAMFELFITEGFGTNDPGKLQEQERQQFLKCIKKFKDGKKLEAEDLPNVEDVIAQQRIGNWLTNMYRMDIGISPPSFEALLPISVLADTRSVCNVKRIYDLYTSFYASQKGEEKEHVRNLRSIQQKFNFKFLNELLPFIISPAWMTCYMTLLLEDAMIVPRLLLMFYFEPALGMVYIPNRYTALLRLGPIRWLGIIYPFQLIEEEIDFDFIERKLATKGWKTVHLWQPKNV